MKTSYYLGIGALVSIIAMFNYDSTEMILKFGLLALFLLILGGLMALENDMKANTDEVTKGMVEIFGEINKIKKTLKE